MSEQKPEINVTMAGAFNLTYFVARSHAMCFYPFLRRNFGREGFGLPGLIAPILMLLYASQTGCSEMLPFLGLWFVALILRRLETFRLIRKGEVMHSCYGGEPDWNYQRLVRNESTVKRLLEPLFVAAVGVAFYCMEREPLGGFFMVGGFSLAFVAGVHHEHTRRRAEAMRDAELEQKYLAGIYRGESDDF